MKSFTVDDFKQYLKQQAGIIVKEVVPDKNFKQVDDIMFKANIKVALKTGGQKNKLYNYNLVAGYYRLIIWNDTDRQSFGFNDCENGISWPEYLIDKNLAYAESIREKSLEDRRKVGEALWLMDICLKPSTNRDQAEKDSETLKAINSYAEESIANYAKSLGERE